MVGDAKFDTSQDIPDFAYDEYAKMLGLEGIRVENPGDVADALDTAMVVRKPVVLNVYTDPNTPMTPPHVNFKQMKSFASAVFHGDSDAWDMIKQTSKDVWAEYFPGK